MSLRDEIIEDLKTIEKDMEEPSFTWHGNPYVFIPSISEFQRQLDTGGFQIVKLLTATVRKYDINWENDEKTYIPIFPNGTPQAQQIINYTLDGTNYRIEIVKHDPVNASMRIIAHSTVKGL